MRFVMRQYFRRRSSPEFFELLGQLASDTQLAVWQQLRACAERLRQAIGRFKKNRGLSPFGGGNQLAGTPPAFDRQKTSVTKLIEIEAGADEGGSDGRNPGDDCKRQGALDAFANQSSTRVGEAGHAGVGD